MPAKNPPPPGPGRGPASASGHRPAEDDDEEEDDEVQEDYDDDEDDDSEFDENAASSSSSVGDDDDDANGGGAVLDGTLALDEASHLHFQGDAFHLVSAGPVGWGVLNFSQWKATSGGIAKFDIAMAGDFRVDVPSRHPPNKEPPTASLKSPPPSASLKAPPPSSQGSNLKSPPPSSAADASSKDEPSGGPQRTFVFTVSVTDYTGTKSDPSITRIDHEHTHVPTHPDCRYHIEATTGTTADEDAPILFRGDYFPKESDDPCRTVCKLVKPRKTPIASPDDAKMPASADHGGPKELIENGKSPAAAATAAASSPYAAATSRGGDFAPDHDDDDDEDDVDGDYDEDVDGDELLALQQEAAMPTAEVLRKRYARADDDPGQDGKQQSATKRGRRRDDDEDDDSDYGF